MNKLICLPLLVVITGCASIAGERTQPISVKTIQDSKEVAGVGCSLMNDAGNWFVVSPGTITVHKSTGDLVVDCKKGSNIAGNETLVSKSNGAIWGNVIVGGGIGYLVDRSTGAGFNYPDSISVVLRNIGEVTGISSQKPDVAGQAAPK